MENYEIEYAIRDRLDAARARARTAALLRQANDQRRSMRSTSAVDWPRGMGPAVAALSAARRRLHGPTDEQQTE